MRDEKLLELIKTDANAGMEKLMREYSGLVYSVCRGRLEKFCDSSEIEDCAADVFMKFYSGLDSFTPMTIPGFTRKEGMLTFFPLTVK